MSRSSDSDANQVLLESLSPESKRIWGKTDHNNQDKWLPLVVHMTDTAEIAKLLWEEWLPSGVKQLLIKAMGGTELFGIKVVKFLAAVHDIGKSTPGFQKLAFQLAAFLPNLGLRIEHFLELKPFSHAYAGGVILEKLGFQKTMALVIASHMGNPPSVSDLKKYRTTDSTGCFDENWFRVQTELVKFCLDYSGISGNETDQIKSLQLSADAQMELAGLVIMADWLASNSDYFELQEVLPEAVSLPNSKVRAQYAWDQLQFPTYWSSDVQLVDNIEHCSHVGESDSNSNEVGGLPNKVKLVEELYRLRFNTNFIARPLQLEVIETLRRVADPGIVVIEAPMGEGKTEVALAAAELLATRTGKGGVYVGLPTMATSDAMFARVKAWVEHLGDPKSANMYLAHSKAALNKNWQAVKYGNTNVGEAGHPIVPNQNLRIGGKNDSFKQLKNREFSESSAVSANEWLTGRKKGVLANFVVGTVDQVLFMALKQKHLPLRHLAMSNKVVIIDEVHAYDAYMNEYLKTALSWLASYNVPVILLSATLPKTVKHDLIKAYLTGKSAVNSSARTTTSFTTTTSFSDTVTDVATNILDTQNEYPVLTYSEGNYVKNFPLTLSARSVEVKVELLPDEEIINLLQAKLSSGGVAGLIFDTVKRAQDFFQQIENAFADEIAANTIRTELFHSRFISLDRLAKEAELVRALGPPLDFSENPRPKKMIAVGTQVLEQSLDIDFDILITDIAPIDLLLQRMGRLHRHNRDARPALLQSPECYITGVVDFESFKFVPGIEIIYGKLFLIRTLEILPDQIFLPDQINPLVQKVYDLSKYDSGDNEVQVNRQALDQHYERERSKKVRSKPFRIPESRRMEDLISVNISASDIKPESGMSQAVRDTNESLEVYLICRKHNGYYLLPWVQNHKIAKGANIPVDNIIPNSLARLISQCSVSLPRELSSGWAIDSVICQLEQNMIDSGLLENWQESSWLAGDLALFLDNNLENEMIVNDKHYKIRYMECLGLQIETSNERSNE